MAPTSSEIPTSSRHWILANKPTGLPTLDGTEPTWRLEKRDIPTLNDGQALVRVSQISNDPAQRGWVQKGIDPARLYTKPVDQNAPMSARVLGTCIASKSDRVKVGQRLTVSGSWSEYVVVAGEACQPIKDIPGLKIKESHYLGALGLNGLTAWIGINDVAKTREGDVVMVSGAAGATGSLVVQMAKHVLGAKKVYGLAGTEEKCRWVESLGADKCLNYKDPDFKKQLVELTPEFVSVFFDNVGGKVLDLMLNRMGAYGRIAACGAISGYNGEKEPINSWFNVVSMKLRIEGFIVLDHLKKAPGIVQDVLIPAVKEGKLKLEDSSETIVSGTFEDVPKTWLKLFSGGNTGKLVTEIQGAYMGARIDAE